ncbi:unnamed protein product [Caenorhabditis sp. 36 PRJEB53466]|nr:unnamed protein product [Caenorhabditis sp. 36 PRJEB53466]
MDTISDRHHRCLFGWVHVSTTMRLILAYFVVYNVALGLLGLPWFSIYIGLAGLCVTAFTSFQVYKKNDRMLFPFYLYVLFTIFYLLFLGGYFFFVNIFHKNLVKDALGDHSDSISFIWHFADIVLIMTHAWVLSVSSKCRKYFRWVREGGQKALHNNRPDSPNSDPLLREARKQDLIAGKPKRSRFTAWFHKRFGTRSSPFAFDNIPYWTSDEVCAWLSSIGMSEYGSTFRKNDIQGSELMHLERSDILEIGINKIGHVKRLQSAILELRAHNQRARRAQARKKRRVAKDYKPEAAAGGSADKRKESSAERYPDGQPSTSSSASAPSGKSGTTRRIPPKDGESAPAVMQKDPSSS